MENFIMFSLCRNDINDDLYTNKFKPLFESKGGKEVISCYKSTTERSFMIGLEHFQMIRDLCFGVFDQESILLVVNGNCKLLFSDDSTIDLGKWTKVNKDHAESMEAFSVVNGEYYIAA